jgi:hypothetical protein
MVYLIHNKFFLWYQIILRDPCGCINNKLLSIVKFHQKSLTDFVSMGIDVNIRSRRGYAQSKYLQKSTT